LRAGVIPVRSRDYRQAEPGGVNHPLDWTPTWAVQVPEFDAQQEIRGTLGSGHQRDSIISHTRGARESRASEIPISDFYPHGEVRRGRRILQGSRACARYQRRRAAFIVDRMTRSPLPNLSYDQLPNVEELRGSRESASAVEICILNNKSIPQQLG
jgi:hypothetical protein